MNDQIDNPPEMLCGWTPMPEAVTRICETLSAPTFGDAAPHLEGAAMKDVLFWDAEIKAFGKTLPAYAQTRGTCVSQGYGRGCQDLLVFQVANGTSDWPAENGVATEPIYAGARVEIGGGRLRGDGCVGAWAAKWVHDYGVLLRQLYLEKYDLRKADDSIAASWGSPRAGCPDDLEPIAKLHPVQQIALLKTGQDGINALLNRYPVPVCSNQGFTRTRDGSGFCSPRGTWSHCMLARGVCTVKGGRIGVAIQQSWGDDPGGNNEVTLESSAKITLPEGVFLIDKDVFSDMVEAGDSWALSDVTGYPPRTLDWQLW